MGRFDLIIGRYEDEPVIGDRDHPPTTKIIRLQEWSGEVRKNFGKEYFKVTLEISPKKSTCHRCKLPIGPGKERYVIWDKYYKNFYHLSCLPEYYKKYIKSVGVKIKMHSHDVVSALKFIINEHLNHYKYKKDRDSIRKEIIGWLKGLVDEGSQNERG